MRCFSRVSPAFVRCRRTARAGSGQPCPVELHLQSRASLVPRAELGNELIDGVFV